MPKAHEEFGRKLGAFEISRRDLLNGALLAAGAGLVRPSAPIRACSNQKRRLRRPHRL
jgi:hypothetical protein